MIEKIKNGAITEADIDELCDLLEKVGEDYLHDALMQYVPDSFPFDFEEDFIKPYGHARPNRSKTRKLWDKLSFKDQQEVVISVPIYKRYLLATGTPQMMPETYLNKASRRWEDFLKEDQRPAKIAQWLIAFFRDKWKWDGYKEPASATVEWFVDSLLATPGVTPAKIEAVATWAIEVWSKTPAYWPSINPIIVLNKEKFYNRSLLAEEYIKSKSNELERAGN